VAAARGKPCSHPQVGYAQLPHKGNKPLDLALPDGRICGAAGPST